MARRTAAMVCLLSLPLLAGATLDTSPPWNWGVYPLSPNPGDYVDVHVDAAPGTTVEVEVLFKGRLYYTATLTPIPASTSFQIPANAQTGDGFTVTLYSGGSSVSDSGSVL